MVKFANSEGRSGGTGIRGEEAGVEGGRSGGRVGPSGGRGGRSGGRRGGIGAGSLERYGREIDFFK